MPYGSLYTIVHMVKALLCPTLFIEPRCKCMTVFMNFRVPT